MPNKNVTQEIYNLWLLVLFCPNVSRRIVDEFGKAIARRKIILCIALPALLRRNWILLCIERDWRIHEEWIMGLVHLLSHIKVSQHFFSSKSKSDCRVSKYNKLEYCLIYLTRHWPFLKNIPILFVFTKFHIIIQQGFTMYILSMINLLKSI